MDVIWLSFSVLFFLCMIILGISLFTPKTAFFFKKKTKRKAILLWTCITLVCLVISNLAGPSPEELQRRLEAAGLTPAANGTSPAAPAQANDPFAPAPATPKISANATTPGSPGR